MHDKWNVLHHPRLTSGGKDEIHYNATDWNLNAMKSNELKSGLRIFYFTFGQLVYWSERCQRGKLEKIRLRSQFKVLMAIFFAKCISLFANDWQFLYYALKQRLSGLELIRAYWGILHCSPMFNWIDALWCCWLKPGSHKS